MTCLISSNAPEEASQGSRQRLLRGGIEAASTVTLEEKGSWVPFLSVNSSCTVDASTCNAIRLRPKIRPQASSNKFVQHREVANHPLML